MKLSSSTTNRRPVSGYGVFVRAAAAMSFSSCPCLNVALDAQPSPTHWGLDAQGHHAQMQPGEGFVDA